MTVQANLWESTYIWLKSKLRNAGTRSVSGRALGERPPAIRRIAFANAASTPNSWSGAGSRLALKVSH